MPFESTQSVLKRVRKPRVHITYNVETGGAIEKRELPLVVGVLADLSGDRDSSLSADQALPKAKDRKFIKIDRDDFDKVMAKIKPRLVLKDVDNTLRNDGSKTSAVLNFEKLSDFNPENVVQQIPELKRLLDLRTDLSNLRSRLDGNDKLDEILQEQMQRLGRRENA